MLYRKTQECTPIPCAGRQIIADRTQQVGADQLRRQVGVSPFEFLGNSDIELVVVISPFKVG